MKFRVDRLQSKTHKETKLLLYLQSYELKISCYYSDRWRQKVSKGLKAVYTRWEKPPVLIKDTNSHELRTSLCHGLLKGCMSRKAQCISLFSYTVC